MSWYDKALELLPTSLHSDFVRAYHWKPRTKSWGWSNKEALQAITTGKKPVYWGPHDNLYGDQGIIEVIRWAVANVKMKDPLRHYILGICFGYPESDVIEFSATHMDRVRAAHDELERDYGLVLDRSWMDEQKTFRDLCKDCFAKGRRSCV